MKTPFAFGVIILGAGASSRMGRPKLLLPWHNTTIIGHIIHQWQELGASQIVVIHRPDDVLMATELDRLKLTQSNRIENPQPEKGMFSSILCAANWQGWKKGISSHAIMLGDQPHLRPDTLRALLQFHQEHPDAVCQPEFQGHLRHPVLLPRKVFEMLRLPTLDTHQGHEPGIILSRFKSSGDDSPSPGGEGRGEGELSPAEARGSDQSVYGKLKQTRIETLKDFLKLIPHPAVQYPMNDTGLSLDLDTPEDYKEALIQFSSHEKS
jgi:molybdenum cofactor cytidylyltransferase